jgi:crotonobetainyl-CoA:carnitine CoA-transferase CaiB-like acyl-CoA transferase
MTQHSDVAAEPLPYAGLRVLDLSQGIAGPSCAGILARQGAEVIKVEPFAGDWARLMGGGRDGITPMSVTPNLGKKAVCINASTAAGAALILRLARDVDVVVESFRPGVMERLGLDYAAISALNPRVLYLSVTGFGNDGPARDLAGADSVLQAMSGMMVMNRDAAGSPQRVGMLLVDAAAGVYAAQRLGAALFARERSGRGERIDITLLAVTAALQALPIIDDHAHAGVAKPPVTVPSGTFRTRDGMVNLTALRDKMFFAMARVLGRPEWADEPAYATNQLRLDRAAEINAKIQQSLLQQDNAYWVERFQINDVLCAPVLDYAQFRAHPQVIHQQLFHELHQPGMGTIPVAALPGLDAAAPHSAAPYLGQHTVEVLRGCGLDEQAIAALEAERVVYVRRTAGSAQ